MNLFVFDRSDDCHYTSTLLRLDPEAFLWLELTRDHQADLVLSVSCPNSVPRVRTFDAASAQLLQQDTKYHWLMAPKPMADELFRNRSIDLSVRSLSELKQGQSFLTWLAETAEINRSRRIALLADHEALPVLLKTGSLNALPSNCTTVLRLPADAAALENVLLKQKDLSNAFPQISQALERSLTPMMSALDLTMADQMLCLHDRPEDVRNLLQLQALRDDSCTDSPAQLDDQARCLYLLRKHRRLFLLSSSYSDAPVRLPTLAKLSGQLNQLHGPLRSRTAELRAKHPGLTIDKALALEQLIPANTPGNTCARQDQTIVFCDNLSGNLHAMQRQLLAAAVPAEFREAAQSAGLNNLSILWNKPRNGHVLAAADQFCDKARRAIDHERWDELRIALYMLRFCSGQVCAEPAQNENLKEVLQLGSEVLDLLNHIATSGWINDTLSGMQIDSAGNYSSITEYTQLLHNAAVREGLSQQQITLLTKRLLLQQKVEAFWTGNLAQDPERLADELAQLQRNYEKALSIDEPSRSVSTAEPEYTAITPQPRQTAPVQRTAAPVPAPQPEPLHASTSPIRETTPEEDLRITRQLLYNANMPGGVNYYDDDDDYDENIEVEDAT